MIEGNDRPPIASPNQASALCQGEVTLRDDVEKLCPL